MELSKLNILLIEDSEKQAEKIRKSYQEAVEKISEQEGWMEKYLGIREVQIDWVQGKNKETKRNNEKFFFYNDSVYGEIEKRIRQNEGKMKTGILLDVSLSKEEYEKASVNDYLGFKMARTIYERFDKDAPVYVVTSIREFSSQVLSLMGSKELIERYVSKALVMEYPSYGVIARTIRYMSDGGELSEREEDDLDSLKNS